MTTALITGASSGLGEHFAYALAREKYSLVLVARREERLRQVADKARSLGSGTITIVPSDLSAREAPAQLAQRLASEKIPVDYLINNAGFGSTGRFVELPLERELEEIDLNIHSLVALTHLFLPAMVERRSGTVMNIASTAAFQPIPYMATYAATKAFVLSFSQALWAELSGTGVNVIAICPGATHTEFQDVAGTGKEWIPSFAWMQPEQVVSQSLEAARRGKSMCINGAINFMIAQSSRLAPRTLVTKIAGGMFKSAADAK